MRPQPLQDRLTRLNTDQSIDFTPLLKDKKRRDSLYAKPCGSALICVHIEFPNNSLVGKLAGESFDRRCYHSARTAPGCPQVEENGQT